MPPSCAVSQPGETMPLSPDPADVCRNFGSRKIPTETPGCAAELHQALAQTEETRSGRKVWPGGKQGKGSLAQLLRGPASWITMLGYRCTGFTAQQLLLLQIS